MNIRCLEYFISVAECGSFSKASAQLGRPQPALSRHIRDLESELRVQLLHRNGRGVVMTEAGECLRQLGSTIIRQIREAQEQIRYYASDRLSSAVIGMPASVSVILLPPLARSLRAMHSDAELRFVDGCNGDLLNGLSSGALDVALVYDAPGIALPNMESVLSQPLYLIERATPGDGPCDDTIEAAQISDIPLVLPGRRHGLRQIVAGWAGRHGLDLDIQLECDSYSSMLQAVSSGIAATILPAASLKREILSGYMRARLITKPYLYRTISLAVSASKPSNACLIDHIKKSFANLREDFLWPQNQASETVSMTPHLAESVEHAGLYV